MKLSILFFGLFLSTTGVVFQAFTEASQSDHNGQHIRKSGVDYEVVATSKEIRVYADSSVQNLPSSLVVRIKNEKGILSRLHLTLNPNKEPNSAAYIGPFPANIYFSAGMTYEIDF